MAILPWVRRVMRLVDGLVLGWVEEPESWKSFREGIVCFGSGLRWL